VTTLTPQHSRSGEFHNSHNVKASRLTKQGFVTGGAAAVAVAGGLLLGIRLRFHHHAPQQLAIGLAFHQQAADELGGDQFGRAGEEGLGEDFCWRTTLQRS